MLAEAVVARVIAGAFFAAVLWTRRPRRAITPPRMEPPTWAVAVAAEEREAWQRARREADQAYAQARWLEQQGAQERRAAVPLDPMLSLYTPAKVAATPRYYPLQNMYGNTIIRPR